MFYFKNQQAPKELLLPSSNNSALKGRIGLSGYQEYLKGSLNFKKRHNSRPLFTIIFKTKLLFQDSRF